MPFSKSDIRETNLESAAREKLNLVSLNAFVPSVVNGFAFKMQSSPRAWTIEKLYASTSSGTCNLFVKINGTNVSGLNNVAVSSTEASTTASSGNSVAEGDVVTIVVTDNSDAVDLAITLEGEFS